MSLAERTVRHEPGSKRVHLGVALIALVAILAIGSSLFAWHLRREQEPSALVRAHSAQLAALGYSVEPPALGHSDEAALGELAVTSQELDRSTGGGHAAQTAPVPLLAQITTYFAQIDRIAPHASGRVVPPLLASMLVLALVALLVAALRPLIRIASQRDKRRRRARSDELAGLTRWQELLAYLDRRIAEARRTDTPLCFAMFEIAELMQIDKAHGQAAADQTVRHVIEAAKNVVRINDRIGRLSDEFGIVLPKSSEENAGGVFGRLNQALCEDQFTLESGQKVTVTINWGIACLGDEDDAASLIARAASALLAAKQRARIAPAA
jgi:diguanylate cyclase (GGDEF)-like protein